jgi:hypothetical protein
MKNLNLSILITLAIVTICFCSFSCKGGSQNKQPLHSRITINDTLRIEGNRIWVREQPKDGEVLFTMDDGALCNILEKGEEQIIRGNKDFWYKIEHEGKIGWVFGSQTSIKQKASLENIEPFLDYFLTTFFFGKNFDSLIYYRTSEASKYIHKEIGVCRLYTPGIYCIHSDYQYNENKKEYFYGNINPQMPEINFYKELPEKGFCDESPKPDGVYYEHMGDDFPSYYDHTVSLEKNIPIPTKYEKGIVIKIKILFKNWFIETMYFIEADDKWWLLMIDDCVCSA